MTRAALLGLVLALLASLLQAGCRRGPVGRKLPAFEGSTPAADLDSLAGAYPVEVSVSGVVADPPDGLSVVLDDGTGLVRVVLPDTVRVPVGTRFLAQGLLLREDGGAFFVEAEEWHYDSTAVPVRSRQP